ncbi:ABC transporter ATP-binding protein [Gleimia hominis]|uniref:ABC transporter ATP-binding protein n=1 Tax=Gleimia hominis TaxID=595468 RepID=UPI000C801A34|nr:ABC transporter ATP-binding protein [Gleimia hominis]WIK65186.1 ABC transporter ATP-binding protein [Gleimia hominis]
MSIVERFTNATVPLGIRRTIRHEPTLQYTTLASVLLGIVEGIGLFLLVPSVSALVSNNSVWGLRTGGWVIVLAVLAVVGFALQYSRSQFAYRLALRFFELMHVRIGQQVARVPLGWFKPGVAARLSRAVSSELMQTGQIVAHVAAPLQTALAAIFTLTVATWFWNPLMGLAMTIAILIFVALTQVSVYLGRMGFQSREPREAELSARIVEFATCQPLLRASGQADRFQPLANANRSWWKTSVRALWLQTGGLAVSGVAAQLVVIALISFSALMVTHTTMAGVAGIGFIIVALRFMETLSAASEGFISMESTREPLKAIEAVFAAKPMPQPQENAPLSKPGEAKLEHVDFGYNPNNLVLRDINIEAPRGSMVALVGPSGCGKTTTAMIIARFYDVNRGRVLVGGESVRDQPIEQLMQQISMVFQDVYLFDDTLEANIAIGNPSANTEEIQRVSELAGVGEIVRRLPQGWKTRVGEGGKRLSGGERQRVSIARALLKKAPIVLLDEATSSLDPENESNIVKAVEELRKTSTVVAIAHKLHTIETADRIYMFTPDGRIDKAGTHSELMRTCPRYESFWKAREDATGWRLV